MKKNILWTLKMTAIYSLLGLMLQAALVNIIFASSSSSAQDLKEVTIKIHVSDVALSEAFNIIEKQTGFTFSYFDDSIPLNEKLSIDMEGKTLYALLEIFARDYGLEFNRINNRIVITKASAEQIEESVENGIGNITGIVTDSLNNEPLAGANVVLLGTSMGSATDFEGKYKILGITTGKYKIKVSYIGYRSKYFDIEIPNDRTLNFDVELVLDVVEGATVVVSGQALGQVAAINRQLSSNTIVNVVSEEKIQELPDANAAEAIGRLPGVALQREGGEANKIVLRGLDAKFTSVTIDGIRVASTGANAEYGEDGSAINLVDDRSVDLSMISQTSLAGIELYKALTSDKDGDAIAGSVNLVTKKAPSQRTIRAEAKGGYNQLDDSYEQYDFNLKYGERFFDDFLGIQLNGILEQKVRSNERPDVRWNQAYDNFTDYAITNLELSYVGELRKRNGLSVLFDINTPDNGTIKINNTLSNTNRNYTTYTRNYPIASTEGEVIYRIRNRENELKSFNSSITGDNYLFGLNAKWGLSFNQSVSEYPYDYEMIFEEVQNKLPGSNTYVSGMIPIPKTEFDGKLQYGPPEHLIPYAVNNFDLATLYEANYREQKNIQKERTIFIDLSKEYSFGKFISGNLKFGGKYRHIDRSSSTDRLKSPYYLRNFPLYEDLPDGSIALKDFTGTSFENLQYVNSLVSMRNFLGSNAEVRNIFDKYSLNPLINLDLIKEWYEVNKNGRLGDSQKFTREYLVNGIEPLQHYGLSERVGAGYIMNTLNLGSIATFIGGIRFESESNSYRSNYASATVNEVYFDPKFIIDTTYTYSEIVWLPNFQLLLKPNDFMNIRLAAYKALSRPDFNRRLVNYLPTSTTVSLTNPKLKDAAAWNYELSTSFYGNKLGLITLSGYYKIIKNVTHLLRNVNIGSISRGPEIVEELKQRFGYDWQIGLTNYTLNFFPYNSDRDTKVWGFEFEHQINFLFLPGLFKNFVLSYNFSINDSETYFVETETVVENPGVPGKERILIYLVDKKSKLERQPRLFGNVSLGYDIGGFSARVSVFFQDEFKSSSRADGLSSNFQKAFSKWDLTLKQQITDNVAVTLNVINFTDFSEGSVLRLTPNALKTTQYQEVVELQRVDEKFGITADLGIRVTL